MRDRQTETEDRQRGRERQTDRKEGRDRQTEREGDIDRQKDLGREKV